MRKNIKRISTEAIVLAAVLLFCGQLLAGEFTADLVMRTPKQSDTMKIYVKEHSYRLEKLEGDNKLLLFRAKGKTTALDPEQKEYRVFKGTDENKINPVAAWENMSYDMEAQAGGEETVNGYECKKYLYNYKGQKEVVFERWLSPELTFVIKQKMLSSAGDAVMELVNIKEETIDKTLFEIPAGYTEAVGAKDLPIAIPGWAKELDSIPVVTPPFEKVMAMGETIRIKTEPGKSIWVRGKSSTDEKAKARAIPFKEGRPLNDAAMYNNFAMKGTICERRHESAVEADFVLVHVDYGEVNVEAKMAEMFEKSVAAGGEFRVPLNSDFNIEMRCVNMIAGESEIKWDFLKEGEVRQAEYAKHRTKVFEKEHELYKGTFSPDGDEVVFKVERGEVLIKLGQFDAFKF